MSRVAYSASKRQFIQDWQSNVFMTKMNVARRTCGYIGSQFWNQGRTQEIRDRVLHLD